MTERKTMADIARLAGVSSSTVSRSLKGNPSIPTLTRDRILRVVEENNYIIDERAQNFRLQRSQTIATLFPYYGNRKRLISDPFYMEMIGAITDELSNYDYDMVIARVPADDAQWVSRYLMNKRADGYIMIDRALDNPAIQQFQDSGANLIVFGPPIAGQSYICVGGQSVLGGTLAVRHLFSVGRRKIGFIGGERDMVETALRSQGYVEGLRECGLNVDTNLMVYTDFTPQAGDDALASLLQIAPDLDAIFVCSDFMAIAIMQMLRDMGRRVPEDIAIVGYDGIQLSSHSAPALTTVKQQIYQSGRLLVQKLFNILDGKPETSLVLPVELIVRESCGANLP